MMMMMMTWQKWTNQPTSKLTWFQYRKSCCTSNSSCLWFVCPSHWAVDVESGNGESGMEHNSTCSMFSVVITLTDEGLDQLCLVRRFLKTRVTSLWYSDKTRYSLIDMIQCNNRNNWLLRVSVLLEIHSVFVTITLVFVMHLLCCNVEQATNHSFWSEKSAWFSSLTLCICLDNHVESSTGVQSSNNLRKVLHSFLW